MRTMANVDVSHICQTDQTDYFGGERERAGEGGGSSSIHVYTSLAAGFALLWVSTPVLIAYSSEIVMHLEKGTGLYRTCSFIL